MLRTVLLSIAVVVSVGILTTSLAVEPAPAADRAEIDTALRSREYARALELIDAALDSAEPARREYLLFRRGLALLYVGEYEQAIEQFQSQLKESPEGPWSHKARFRQADAHVALKQFEAAQRIYAERVRTLVGDERKARIAQVYLDFAGEYFSPPDPLTKPDYAKARTFYERALELEPGESLRDQILYRRAQCNQKLGSWEEAAGQYEQYLLVFDEDYRERRKLRNVGVPLPAGAAAPGKHRIAARFSLGECRLQQGNLVEARRTWQDLLSLLERIDGQRQEHGDTWVEATYLLSKTYQMPEPPDTSSLTLGVQTLETLLGAAPSSRRAIQAAHDIGKAYAHLGRHDEAIAALRSLVDRETIRPDDDQARELAETLSQDALFTIGGLYFAQKKYDDAIGAWNQYVARYPNGPQWSAAQQRIVDAEFQIGLDAMTDKRYDDARTAWTAFLQKYPLDSRAPTILMNFGTMACNRQLELEKDGKSPNWNEPIGHWRRLVNKYPGTEQAGWAQFRIADTLEQKAQDLEAAIEEYRKLTWSNWAQRARQREREMTATRLNLVTERVFRTDQTARIRVDTRNVETLTVKLYRIDTEDYFRKSHSLRGVEGLDLLLIDPDQTMEVPVEGYARYRPISQEIEIPFDGPGVFAVNVSNEKSGEKQRSNEAAERRREDDQPKLEATTLLVRSDIDIIVKTSRRAVLVFAQNMRTSTPAGGVNILVSDGKQVVLTGKTGADGVWLTKSKDMKDRAGISVFAEQDGHVAGNALSLEGLGFSTGLGPRGYLYTDRPAYRPGDAVNIRGILREVKEGQYALPKQPDDQRLRWKLDVVDPKGRVLTTEAIRLSEFGTCATQFRVAADAPVGEYKLIAHRPDGPTFTGSFRVETFQLAKAYLQFDFDERVVMRGEKTTGSIVAKYHYGEPVVDKPIEYAIRLPTGEEIRRSGVTDEGGKVAFEFDSTALPEEGRVWFTARQAELGIDTGSHVWVAVRAFRAEVSTLRPLFLSEEPVEVTVTTKDLKGEPIAREMTLTALLRTYDRASRSAGPPSQAQQAARPTLTWAETKVETVTVKTDQKTGRGRATLKLTKGGTYVLRAEGKDRFDHTITAETTVQISDADDKTRVRIFSDRQHYKVGEKIALDVHSRLERPRHEGDVAARAPARPDVVASASPAVPKPNRDRKRAAKHSYLALITYEGEEIIGYRTLKLQKGHNRYELPVEHAHFPNFAVGVSVMAGNKFHAASREFTVERQLNIALKPNKDVYRPRDEMELEITVTDQQGNPVAAEVGLAMVDNALLTKYPDTTPDIVAFFQEGARRHAAMRTQTSCTFRYQAQTRVMVTELLAEADRIDDEQTRLGQFVRVRLEAGRRALAASARLAPAEAPESQSTLPGDMVPQHQTLGYTADQLERFEYVAGAVGGAADRAGGRYIFGGSGRGGPGERAEEGLFVLGVHGEGYDRRSYGFQVAGEPTSDSLILGVPFDRIAAGREVRAQVEELLRERYVAPPGSEIAKGVDAKLGRLVHSAPPRTYFPELAYWNPQITADENGHATVRIVLPDSNTKWKLIARGVSGGHRRDAGATPGNDDYRRDADATLVGAGEAEVISKTDFFVELLAPPNLVEGDKFRPRARVHCLTAYEGEIEVTLRVKGPRGQGAEGPGETAQTRTLKVSGSGVYDVEFDEVEIVDAGDLVLEVSATTRDEVPDAKRKLSDVIARAIPVRPWGMRIEAHAAGLARDNQFVEIELPTLEGTSGEYHDRRLTVAVGPGMQRWLIEEALEAGERWKLIERSHASWKVAPPRSHADTASALLGCLYAADYVRATERRSDKATKGNGSADMRLLNQRAAGLIAQLLAAQNDDGGWAWTGKNHDSDPWTSGHVAWALSKAKRDGLPVAEKAIGKLTARLQKAFADAQPSQTELKAVVLHGLSWVDQADYAHANRLHRNRQSLSNAALGHLALTFVRLDRKSIGAELLGVLEHRMKQVSAWHAHAQRGHVAKMLPADGSSAWMNSDLEVTALALLAQLAVDPRAASVRPMVNYLAGAARADGWRPHKARGSVIAALATYYGGAGQRAANYTLSISVDGRETRRLTSDDVGSVCIELTEADLGDGKQRVDFAFAGRGEYAYAVTLSGFSRRYPHTDALRHDVLRVYGREVSPPPLEYKGRVVNRGFNVARDFKWFRNSTASQAVGAVVPVGVRLRRYDRSNNPAGDRDYVIVQETIPAGCRLLTETLRGSHLAYDYSNNVLTLYYGSRRNLGRLHYNMVATTPGTYRIPATTIRSLYRPEVYHLNPADQAFTVLPRGSKSPDEYRLTPDELYNLGRMHFDDGDHPAAGGYLRELLAGKWVLHDEPYRESVRMLLNVALAASDPDGTVNYFEILKEKHPELVIPFEQIVQVADAYSRTSQHERAYLIYRATADASFANDTAVGGVLQDEGNFLESIDLLEDLWREYPDTPQVESIYYAISQTLYAKAAQPGSVRARRGTASGRVTRDDIIRETISLLERFLALYPQSPIGDEASYSLANAYLDLDDFQTVLRRTDRMIKLFPKSKWLDRFRYIQALAFFHLADFEKARTLAHQVAEATYRDQQGVVRPSPNKWLALYIIGQIYHAQGKTADAIEFYQKVKERFSDADEAISYFEHQFVSLPEVTIFHPTNGGFREAEEWQQHLRNNVPAEPSTGDDAVSRTSRGGPTAAPLHPKPFVQLDYRNIKAAVLQVYRVDLMKLALVEKNLAEITSVNLAGIKPLVEKTVTLGDGHDYVDKSLRVELDLPPIDRFAATDPNPERQPGEVAADVSSAFAGAYLVICRGDDLFSSGLVLVTPLALEVQDDLAAQRVRVTAVDAITRRGLKNVHVKVIGTGMKRFVAGETDLRGVFIADAVSGHPTAIARDTDGRVAFYRSEGAVLAMAEPTPEPDKPAAVGKKADYRANLQAENQALQDFNTQKLRTMFKGQQRGVQVQEAQ